MTVALGLLVPRRSARALDVGVGLYAAATVAAYLMATQVGSNVGRLGPLLGGPLLACALLSSRASVAARAPFAAALCAYSLIEKWQFEPGDISCASWSTRATETFSPLFAETPDDAICPV